MEQPVVEVTMILKSEFTLKIKTNVVPTLMVQLKEHYSDLKPSNKH